MYHLIKVISPDLPGRLHIERTIMEKIKAIIFVGPSYEKQGPKNTTYVLQDVKELEIEATPVEGSSWYRVTDVTGTIYIKEKE